MKKMMIIFMVLILICLMIFTNVINASGIKQTNDSIILVGDPTDSWFYGEGLLSSLFIFTPIYYNIDIKLSFGVSCNFIKILINGEEQIIQNPINVTINNYNGFGSTWLFRYSKFLFLIGKGNISITPIETKMLN